jgi:hypothetical protein
MENVSQDNRSEGRDLNPGRPEYEAGVLTTRPRRLVTVLYEGGIYVFVRNILTSTHTVSRILKMLYRFHLLSCYLATKTLQEFRMDPCDALRWLRFDSTRRMDRSLIEYPPRTAICIQRMSNNCIHSDKLLILPTDSEAQRLVHIDVTQCNERAVNNKFPREIQTCR